MGVFQYSRYMMARGSASKMLTLKLCRRYYRTLWQSSPKKKGLILSMNLMSFSERVLLACLVSVLRLSYL